MTTRVEDALRDADSCKETDEGDCGTGAIVLAAEVRRLQAENDRFRKALEEIASPRPGAANVVAIKALSAPVAGEGNN